MKKIRPLPTSSGQLAKVIGHTFDALGLAVGGLLTWKAFTGSDIDWFMLGYGIGAALSCFALGVGLVVLAEIVENLRIIAHNSSVDTEP